MGYVVQHNHNKNKKKNGATTTTITKAQHKLIARSTTNEKCWRRCLPAALVASTLTSSLLLAARCHTRHCEMCTSVYMCTFVPRACCCCCCCCIYGFAAAAATAAYRRTYLHCLLWQRR